MNTGRLSVVAPETARVAELLPDYLRTVETVCAGAPSHAPRTQSGVRLLVASRTFSIVTVYANAQYSLCWLVSGKPSF
jgi:hypothetical protein